MKRNDIAALHEKTVVELKQQLLELKQQLAQAQLERAARRLTNVSLLARLSDDIARVATIIRAKELVQKETV